MVKQWAPPIEELARLRRARGRTLRDIAKALGVTEATISRCERGLQQPSSQLLAAWTKLLTGKRPAVERTPRSRRWL